MKDTIARYFDPKRPLSVIDIDFHDVNGSYGTLFKLPEATYCVIDLEGDVGVNNALKSPYDFPLAAVFVELIASDQVFEHIEYFWKPWLEIFRVHRPGDTTFLIAPSRGSEDKYSQDYWRCYTDGYGTLSKYVGCQLLKVTSDWQPDHHPASSKWGDTVGVFKKTHSTTTLLPSLSSCLVRISDKLIHRA
jgi:hypothetical protein